MQQCHSPCAHLATLRGSCCPFMFLHSFWAPFSPQGRSMPSTMVRRTLYRTLLLHLVPVLSTAFRFAEAIYDYCGGNMTVTGVKATAGIFATYPAPYLSLLGGFIDQVAVKPSRVGSGHNLHSFALCICDLCVARCLGRPCFCSASWLCLTRTTNPPQRAANPLLWVFWFC